MSTVFLNGSDHQFRKGVHRHYLPTPKGAGPETAPPVVTFIGGQADINDSDVLRQLVEAPKSNPNAVPIASATKQECWGLCRLGKEPQFIYGAGGEKVYLNPTEATAPSGPPAGPAPNSPVVNPVDAKTGGK